MAELGAAAVIGGVPQGLFTGQLKQRGDDRIDESQSEESDEEEVEA